MAKVSGGTGSQKPSGVTGGEGGKQTDVADEDAHVSRNPHERAPGACNIIPCVGWRSTRII
jgi:hypothetical protein